MKTSSLLILLLFLSGFSTVQTQRISHQEYLNAIGFEDEGIVMRNILRSHLKERFPDETENYYTQNASFFSMILIVSGVMPFHFYHLDQNGIDVINAITADVRPFKEQSLLADVAVLAEVLSVETGQDWNDGFDVTVTIRADQMLKGSVPGDTLYIRQRNASRLANSNTRPETGAQYLFLLSSGVYGYQSANFQFRSNGEAEVKPPGFGEETTFVIYRLYPYQQGILQRSPENFEQASAGLRLTDKIIND